MQDLITRCKRKHVMGSIPRLTIEAKAYAVYELARRAGVPREWISEWRLSHEEGETIVHTNRPVQGSLIFPETKLAGVVYDPELREPRFAWPFFPLVFDGSFAPDLIVPFSESTKRGRPIFSLTAGSEVRCAADLLTPTILIPARWEEGACSARDRHGRFPGGSSAAARHGYLHRPVVDEYGLALQQVLKALAPRWQPEIPNLRVNLSHDIDDSSVPFAVFQVQSAKRRYGTVGAAIRQIASATGRVMSADLRGTIILNRMRHKYKLSSAMYWMAVTSQTEFDEGYDPASPQIRRLIDYLHDDGIEIGVHPSYYAFDKPEVLRKEISYLRSLLPFPIRGSRQHFLRWAPRTWAELETSGLMYDSSVGYHDVIGFRAGTSLPYRPWFIDQNRPANLVEVPLLVMDHTIQERMALSPEHALHRVRDLLTRCRMAGGVFTMLWHNTTIQLPRYAAMRKAMLIPLLEEIAGSPGYDVEKDLGNILVPSFIDNKRT